MSVKMVRHVCFASAIVASSLLVAAKLSRGQRVFREGEIWLNWTGSEQEGYVYGFAAAYGAGYESACRRMDQLWKGPVGPGPENDPLRMCASGEIGFSEKPNYYVEQITEFYRRYPADRDLDIDEVLEQVGRGLTAEQIHCYPFPRKGRPKDCQLPAPDN